MDNTVIVIEDVEIEFLTSKGTIVTRVGSSVLKTINSEGEDCFYKKSSKNDPLLRKMTIKKISVSHVRPILENMDVEISIRVEDNDMDHPRLTLSTDIASFELKIDQETIETSICTLMTIQ
jgi:hypothetical protein